MTQFSKLPTDKQVLLNTLTALLSTIDGVAAVVLGGSYAAGTQHESSDLDIGIYYDPQHPFSISEIKQAAEQLSEGLGSTVTGFYEWGAWVNGGAWIQTPHGKVDFLYRNLEQVQHTIDDAHQGISHHDYDQQPSTGFYSVIYLAETQICIPLYDPEAKIALLKQQVATYPSELKQKTIHNSLWSAEFSLLFAKSFAAQGDIYNVTACFSRIAANLTQALFAINETYFIREKQLMQNFNNFTIIPENYGEDLTRILSTPGSTAEDLAASVEKLRILWYTIVGLTNGDYQSKFNLK